MGQNVFANAEPSPAILPGCGDGLRLDPIATAEFNALGTRNSEHTVAAAVAKRPACASGYAEGVATKPEHAVSKDQHAKKQGLRLKKWPQEDNVFYFKRKAIFLLSSATDIHS